MGKADSSTVVFYAPCPDLEQLSCFQIVFERPGDNAPGRQVLRCRELIFNCGEVVASPAAGGDSVMAIYHTMNAKLSQVMANMKARVVNQWGKIDRSQLECCLRYTLRARLAPQWNQVGPLLVQGRSFLSQTAALSGVRATVTVSDGDICVSTECHSVSLPRLTLEDLQVSPKTLQQFNSNTINIISEHYITSRWCYILPSMRKGQVVSVTRFLPSSTPFKSYKDLKRYWKNMYGYRLDESDPPYYINIGFRAIGALTFTYPPQCLRSAGIVYLSRTDPRPVLTSLLRDIHLRFGGGASGASICGAPLVFSGRPSKISTQLWRCSQIDAQRAMISANNQSSGGGGGDCSATIDSSDRSGGDIHCAGDTRNAPSNKMVPAKRKAFAMKPKSHIDKLARFQPSFVVPYKH